MICPRCSVADIPEGAHQCPLCGFHPSAIMVEQPVDAALETVQNALGEQFEIQAVLRLGERSFVYLAREYARDRLVALKVIPVPQLVDHELIQRFERQAGLAASLQHAHIVRVHSYGATRAFLWYTMDHVRALSLAEVLRGSGPMDLETCLRIVEQVASALDHAHRLEIVHGNLRPSNIFVDQERWVQVSDFAIREAFGRPARAGAPVVQLPEYMAPEQFYARTVGASADQYALAVIVFQCLTGTLPFVGDSFEEVARLQANEPPPRLSDLRPDLPLHVLDAVQRGLAKVPAGRFPTVLDFAAALATGRRSRASAGFPRRISAPGAAAAPAPPVLVVSEAGGRLWRRRVLMAAAVIGVGVLSVALVLRPQGASALFDRVRARLGSGREAPQLEWQRLEPPPTPPSATQPPPPAAAPSGVEDRPPLPRVSEPRAVRRPVPSATAAPPVEPGRLFINATPWGTVYVDGERVGNTPRANLEIAPGLHRVRVERDGFEPYERQIMVAPGQVVRLVDIVLAPKPQ